MPENSQKSTVNMLDLVFCLTSTGDLISPVIANHHKRVGYLAYRLARQLGMSQAEQKEIFLAGLMHDIGAFSIKERLELTESEPEHVHAHAFIGADILKNFPPLEHASEMVRYHHVPWADGAGTFFRGEPVPDASHLLHLADRTAVLLIPNRDVLGQIPGVCARIRAGSGTLFHPKMVEALLSISNHEYIWLDVIYDNLLAVMPPSLRSQDVELTLDEMVQLTEIFAHVIDFRSPFTARHSVGVAEVATRLAELMGFSPNECKMMLCAGHLHDLGKLAVPEEILEKADKLNPEEFNQMRSHTYYTYRTLQMIRGFETINLWASLHHERLNGKGYPFHLTRESIPLGSRVMSVADVFTAITEDRPYRKGMSQEAVLRVIDGMVENDSLCPRVVQVLKENLELLSQVRLSAQTRADQSYQHLRRVYQSYC